MNGQYHPIESASGTTSPNNSKSGNSAYIVTAICVVLICIITAATTSCISDAITLLVPRFVDETFEVIEETIDDPEGFVERIDDEDGLDGDSFEDYFEQIFGEEFQDVFGDTYGDVYDDIYGDMFDRDRGRDGSDAADSFEFDTRNVLNLDLAIYDNNIDDMVSANAYAGADTDVKDFVRELVLADRNATNDLIHEMRAAGRDGEDFLARLDAAHEVAIGFIDEIDTFDVPSAADGVESHLQNALDHAHSRWEAIADFMLMLGENETITDRDLEAIDDTIHYETRNAAQALEDALAESAD